MDAAGNFYVADTNHGQIVQFNDQWVEQWKSPVTVNNPHQIDPWGICVDGANNIYVSDDNNHRLVKIAANTKTFVQWGHTGDVNVLKAPAGLAVGPDGNVYVADVGNNRIAVFDKSGNSVRQFGRKGKGVGEFDQPWSVAFNARGDIYVCDQVNNRIQRFTINGWPLGSWGSPGNGDGQFNNPLGVAVDRLGRVYVSDTGTKVDTGNSRIQVFTSEGCYLTQVGSFGPNDGQLNQASGLIVDAACNIYIADTANDRIEQFSSDCTPQCTDQTPGQLEAWLLNGNSGTDPSTKNNFLGTTDGKPLVIRAEGGVGIGVTDLDKSLGLDVRRRIRLRDGDGGETAGLYLNTAHSQIPEGRADIAFIGALDATRIGFFGSDPRTKNGEEANPSAWWGLTFDTVTGNVRIGDHKRRASDVTYPTHRFEVICQSSTPKVKDTGVAFMDQNGKGVEWIPGANGWSSTSDRNVKEGVTPVDPVAVLDKMAHLTVSEWSYKGYSDRHIGPMAQDFHREFPMGGSEKMISDMDEQGVALAAIQGLNTLLHQKDSEIAMLQKELKELEQRMAALEASAKASAH